jgi:hypothetical protein
MMIAIPSIGALILVLLAAYLILGTPTSGVRSALITVLNVVLLIIIVYFILGFFGVL